MQACQPTCVRMRAYLPIHIHMPLSMYVYIYIYIYIYICMYIHISTCTLSAYAVFVLDGLRIKNQEQPARTKNFRLKSPTYRPLSSSFWGLPY